MTQCSGLNCKNKGVHAYPKDRKRRRAWENALRIKNFKAKDTSRLCSMHFRSEDYHGQSKYTSKLFEITFPTLKIVVLILKPSVCLNNSKTIVTFQVTNPKRSF